MKTALKPIRAVEPMIADQRNWPRTISITGMIVLFLYGAALMVHSLWSNGYL